MTEILTGGNNFAKKRPLIHSFIHSFKEVQINEGTSENLRPHFYSP